jgi:uncharacterized protein (TIGR00288 family)
MIEEKLITNDKIAVLIDFENVGLSAVQTLFDQLSDYGHIVLKRAYADWSKAKSTRDQILRLGIEPVQIFRSPTKRKNTCDIGLTIGAIELLYTSSIDTFVFVSSDSDFVPLINKLRSSGKKVFIAGDQTKALDTLRISCDQYFEIEHNKSVQPASPDSENIMKTKPNATKSKAKKTEKNLQTASKPQIDDLFGQQIDQAWSKRATKIGESIPGPNAASDAVKILKIENLKTSPYKTLQRVIEANPLLIKHWQRNKNTIVRK